jgi:hypothetical protein
VLRPPSLPHALAVVAAVLVAASSGLVGVGLVGPDVAAHATAALPVDPEQPLVPRIQSITPDYVPDKGPIVIRGTVTNRSDQTWTAINVHGFMGSTPMTTATDLSDAVKSPVDADVGDRITVSGTFASIPRLAPGEATTFKIRLPQSTLSVSTPGVYWFGVHVLGDNGEGGTRVAVGRDRTFIPYVPQAAIPGGGHEDAALVLPLRAGVTRAADGSVLDPEEWGSSLQSGALQSLITTAEAAGGRPLTWLLDPAVLDVVRRLAHGNPTRTLTAPETSGPGNPSSPASPSDSASASDSSEATRADTTSAGETAKIARRWLRQVRPLLGADTGELLGLPYGDLAVDTAARYDEPLLRSAFRRTGHTLSPWGLPLRQAVSPPDGRTTDDTLTRLPRDADVLLSDTGVDGADSVVNRVSGRRVLLISSAGLEGGPGPVPPLSSLALRQRVLAEAAVRVLDDQQPLLLELPTELKHPLRPKFFNGLDVPWLRLTTVSGATAATPARLDPTALREPADEPQLGPRLYVTAQDVLERGATLQSVLTGNHALRRRLFEEVTGNASYTASATPYLALARMRETASWVRGNLADIDLAAPESVTLASSSGRFSAVVSNELDVPVTVKVRAVSDGGLTVTGGEKVTLAPHGRTTVLLNASTDQRGVHNVRLELTNATGRPLGATDTFPMRAEQVSRLIWVIIGAGLALLFAAIVVRLVRRIIAARAGRGVL